MWSHFAMPIGPRASAMLIVTPNCAKARTKAPIGARLPWSTTVPAQSRIAAWIFMRRYQHACPSAPTAQHAVMQDHSEGDINLGDARAAWQRGYIDAETRALLDEDSRWFLHQALSTPCLNVVERAEGIYLIDTAGRRIMDFHGNTVHQVGYGHPRVIEAVTRQLATLPFSPRRYTNRAAIELARRLAELAPGRLNKVLFAPCGTAAIGMALKLARHATGRHKTVSMWDAFHGASLDAISVGGEAIFRRDAGPLLPGTEHVPPPALAARFFGDDGRAHERLADYIDYVLEVQGDVGGGDRRTGALDNVGGAACGFLAARARKLRPARRAADLRRDPELPGTHRHDVRVRAGGLRAGHAGAGQRARRRRVSDGGADRARGSGCRGRSRAGALHA